MTSLLNRSLVCVGNSGANVLTYDESRQLLAVPHCQPPGGGGGGGFYFTTNLTPQGRAFSGALKNEKFKAPLFPGPRGAGDTNDWCITRITQVAQGQRSLT